MSDDEAPVKRGATYADLMDLPEHVVGELINGNLYATPRPRWRHALLAGAVAEQVRGAVGHRARGADGWWIVAEPELHLGAQVVVPDLAGWRRDRTPSIPPDATRIEIAPDWVCEILSPSTARRDRGEKLPIYAGAGVGHAWIVDPVACTLEVLRRVDDAWLVVATHGGAGCVSPEPFAASAFDLAEWWSPDRP